MRYITVLYTITVLLLASPLTALEKPLPSLNDLAWAFNITDFEEKVRILKSFTIRHDMASLLFLDSIISESTDIVIRMTAMSSLCSGKDENSLALARKHYRDKNHLVSAYAINFLLMQECNNAQEVAEYAFNVLTKDRYVKDLDEYRKHRYYRLVKNKYLVDSFEFMMELIIGSCQRLSIKPPYEIVEKYASDEDFALIFPVECSVNALQDALRYSIRETNHPLRSLRLTRAMRKIRLTRHKPASLTLLQFLTDESLLNPVDRAENGKRVCDIAFETIIALLSPSDRKISRDNAYPDAIIKKLEIGLKEKGLSFDPSFLLAGLE